MRWTLRYLNTGVQQQVIYYFINLMIDDAES